jgi:uncharacterized iron-regulated membrane protein
MDRAALYRAIWRWHFYAGLFCIPFIVVLSLTGSLYLFAPQINAWEDGRYAVAPLATGMQPADTLVAAAQRTQPEGLVRLYRLPDGPGRAAEVEFGLEGGSKRLVYVDPYRASVVGEVDPDSRLMAFVRDIHGELTIGKPGSWLVELAASWAIVMIITGLFLWWPRGAKGAAGVLYPRLGAGKRLFWRDLHAVTGVWISSLALFLLISGLPWTEVWGDGFREVRKLMTVKEASWSQSRAADHDHSAHDHGSASVSGVVSLQQIVAFANGLALDGRLEIRMPGQKLRGLQSSFAQPVYVLSNATPNRPKAEHFIFDAATGQRLAHETFADKPLIDRVVGVGVAAHEGQLFGPLNQLLGVVTALGLVTLSVSGVVMWWRRRPTGQFGVPSPSSYQIGFGVAAIIIALGLFLPLLGASLIAVAIFDLTLRWVHSRLRPRVASAAS